MDVNRLAFAYGLYLPTLYVRGEPVTHYLQRLEQSQWAPLRYIEAMQERKLAALLQTARTSVPFYQDRIPAGTPAVRDLPFLSKSDIQASWDALRNRSWRGAYTLKTTGGSTGQTVTIRKSRDATAQETAANWRGFGWAGVRMGDRQGRFWGVPFTPLGRLRARVSDFIGNRLRCSAFAFSEADLARYTRALNRFKPAYFYGYVSMLEEYARYVLDNGVRLAFQPRAVITTAEVLTASARQTLEQAFGCRVFNEYGCGELGTIAHECGERGLHINAENLLVEIFDKDRPCAPDEIGEIVVTELNNHVMPLIRYRLGDFAALSAEPCGCGRPLPVLSGLAGRGYDLVYNRGGKMFHGEFFMYMFEEAKRKGCGVKAFQVVQESYENFSIRVVPGGGYSEATRALVCARFREGYGAEARLKFVEVQDIPRRASGKMQLIVGLNAPSI